MCDLDGTLIVDRSLCGNTELVRPMPGVVKSIAKLRSRGLAIGLVTNQSAVARGLVSLEEVLAVNWRVAELIGPFDTVAVCTHELADQCQCRMPAPGMIAATARVLHLRPSQCVVVGNSGVDIGAARLAGAAGLLLAAGDVWTFPAPWRSDDPLDGYAVGSFAEAARRILEYC